MREDREIRLLCPFPINGLEPAYWFGLVGYNRIVLCVKVNFSLFFHVLIEYVPMPLNYDCMGRFYACSLFTI